MSFILDALKKSELERQRQTVPGLMDTRSTVRRNRLPLWAAALGALLIVNLTALTWVLMHRRSSVPAPPAVAAKPADAPPPAAHFSPLDAAPEYAPEIPVPSATDQRPASHETAPASHRPDPLLSEPSDPPENQEILPSISELNLTGAQALPELHLDVHVYATKPSERFVYINMRKYHEGSVLQEGPKVERIRRDGVVLNYQGLRFILPRQP